jgi:hypothetical protein
MMRELRLLATLGLVLGMSVMARAASTPEETVHVLFDAMRSGNGDAIREIVLPKARLGRLQADGTIKDGTFESWITRVDGFNEGDADEQVFGVKTLSMSPELATVWAPFTIRFKGELVGCGVNQFTLAKTIEGWRIVYGIDMPAQVDCETYPDRFKAE